VNGHIGRKVRAPKGRKIVRFCSWAYGEEPYDCHPMMDGGLLNVRDLATCSYRLALSGQPFSCKKMGYCMSPDRRGDVLPPMLVCLCSTEKRELCLFLKVQV
jgi:hypothetical protein